MKSNLVKTLILTGYGINAEKELKWAFDLAGSQTDIIHLEDLIENKSILKEYQILGFAGGFSFGDHIASGKVFANLIKYNIMDELKDFIEKDNLVIGICNGFQVITKLGLVPSFDNSYEQVVSLVENDSGHFEDRWVRLKVENQGIWLKDIDYLYLPVRHGEGKFVVKNQDVLDRLIKNNHIALKYVDEKNNETMEYPYNPNGSIMGIAGITNEKGNVFGLMPHPEAFYCDELHPNWTEGKVEKFNGLSIFKNAVNYFK